MQHLRPWLALLAGCALGLAGCGGAPRASATEDPFASLSALAPPERATEDDAALDDATFDDAVPVEGLERALANSSRQLRRCYDRGLADDPTLRGRVRVRIVVAADGRSRVDLVETDLPDDRVVDCILSRLRAVAFEPPKKARYATAEVPLTFLPAGG